MQALVLVLLGQVFLSTLFPVEHDAPLGEKAKGLGKGKAGLCCGSALKVLMMYRVNIGQSAHL